MISAASGRPVRHRRLSEDELAARWLKTALPEQHARGLAAMDVIISNGAENRVTDEIAFLTGQKPRNFEALVARYADVWHRERHE